MLKYYLHFAGHVGISTYWIKTVPEIGTSFTSFIVNEERILEKLVLNFKLNCILYVNQVKLEPDNN